MSALIPSPTIIAHLGLIFVIFNMLVMSAAFMVWLERKVCAWIQDRNGPNRVGFEGLLQPFADVFKLMMKEDLRPKAADAALFAIAPIISCITAFAAFSVVPFGTETTLFGLLEEPIPLQVTDVNVAVLVIFAIASMGVYGIVLAGWASNSKYSLLGGLRSSAQMISYELSYGMALAAVIMLALAARDRHGPVGLLVGVHPEVVRVPPADRLLDLHDRRRGRDQPRAVRLSGGGAGAGRGVSH
jgi:NADH-quinone oxidoreductase subunit H